MGSHSFMCILHLVCKVLLVRTKLQLDVVSALMLYLVSSPNHPWSEADWLSVLLYFSPTCILFHYHNIVQSRSFEL